MAKGHGEQLSRKQEQAIAALLGQPAVEQAAAAISVNEKTLRNWMKLPTFQAAYRDARRQIVEGAVTRLQQLTTGAVLTLNRNLSCGNPAVEVRASQIILDQALRGVELGEVLQRLGELERQLAGAPPAAGPWPAAEKGEPGDATARGGEAAGPAGAAGGPP
jgi:hypothetical protein